MFILTNKLYKIVNIIYFEINIFNLTLIIVCYSIKIIKVIMFPFPHPLPCGSLFPEQSAGQKTQSLRYHLNRCVGGHGPRCH